MTPWAVARQAPLSMGILQARILEWVAMPPLGDPPNSGIEPTFPASLAWQADSLPLSHWRNPRSTLCYYSLVAQLCLTLCNLMGCSPPGSSVHGIFPGRNTRTGCHFLLLGVFLTQGSNLCLLHLLHWQADCLLLRHLGIPSESPWLIHLK